MSNDEVELERPAVILRSHLRAVDQAIKLTGLTNKEQISIGVLATALAFRRLIEAGLVGNRPLTRGERMKLIKSMTADFEKKIRNYGGEGQEEE